MGSKLVIIPTYNEIENIEAIIRKIFSLNGGYNVLVIDDGSPDGTADKVCELRKEFAERLDIIRRPGKMGLGTAYIEGFKWSLAHGYDFTFEMDADFSHNPDDLDGLYKACTDDGADMSIGSRYCNGISVVNWPLKRILISYFASKYVRNVLNFKICDSTAGFVCYSRRVLESLDFDKIRMKGYGFQIEMKYTAHKKGFRIVEVPVIFINRKLGVSKMSSGIFGEAFWGVLRLRFRKF